MFDAALDTCQTDEEILAWLKARVPEARRDEANRWLLEEILVEGRFHPEMVGSGWVQHYSTWESCPECAQEFEE